MVKNLKKTLALMLSIIMIFSSTLMTYADDGIIGSNEADTSAQIEETVAAEAETSTNAPEVETTTQETQVEAAAEVAETVEPKITEQPKDAAVRANDVAEFTLETNSQVKSCQWQTAEALNGTWKNLNRYEYGTSETLKIRDVENYNKNFFRCIVTFKDGTTAKSDEVRLTIVAENDSTARVFGSSKDVKVFAPDGAFPAGTEMTAQEVEDTDAVQSIIDDTDKVDGEVISAVDITFTKNETEIQPQEAVSVTMNVGKDADFDNLTLVHINANKDELDKDGIKAEKVDFTADKEAGTITFEAEHFSTYTLVWGDPESSATIKWGYMDGETFKELEEGSTVTLDTSASTLSINDSFEGYLYMGATYCEPGQTMGEGVSITSTLYKTTSGWACDVVNTEDDSTTRTNIAANSTIYVTYFQPGEGEEPAEGADDDSVPSPVTEKEVTDNGDGTYTITLDTTGTKVTEDKSHYANILVILDATTSMRGAKWTNAKTAMNTLIETLTEGDNAQNAGKIDFALVTFGRSATVVQNWTKDNAAFKSTCAGINMVSTSGTNWEAGMRGGLYGVLNSYPEGETAENHDPTYVIFLTDGDPNTYYWQASDVGTRYRYNGRNYTVSDSDVGDSNIFTNDHMRLGYEGDSAVSAERSADEAKAIAQSTNLYGIYCGDSGATPSGESFNRLVRVITGTGQGGKKTIAANADTIESEFQKIAETALKDMGASNASVDDGVPNLSGISANTTGEAKSFEYYIKEKGQTEFTEWADAPGATYNKENGVTWDLSKVGTLPEGTTYRIKFDVWPSQEAYDLIADLNNGLKDYDDLPDKQKAAVTGNKDDGYTLVTNTHLNTKYTFKDTLYSDSPEELTYKAMPLPTKPISVKKNWPENMLDKYGAATYRDEDGNEHTATEITLNLQKDKADYLDVTVKAEEGWQKDNIYVSCGNMVVKNGQVTIHEPGHDYQLVEPKSFSYYWDLISDVYHPMVINGVATLLVLDEKATTANNTDTFEINGKIYRKHSDTDNTLEGYNYRRSNLNLTKAVSSAGGENNYFTYTATVEDANSTDGKVWFSAWDPTAGESGALVDEDWVISGATKQTGDQAGYWTAENGATVTFKIKPGWNIRYLNLYHGSTFSFQETDLGDYTLEKVEAKTQYNFMDPDIGNTWYTRNGATMSGRIVEPNNSYTVTYTNNCNYFYIYHSGVAGDGNLEKVAMSSVQGTYNLYEKTTPGTLYGGYYLDYAGKGNYKDDGIKGTTGVAYTGMNYDWSSPETVDGTAMTPVAGETYYIKEVPTYYLRNYHQINFMRDGGDLKALYLISAVDDLNYKETGVTITSKGEKSKVVSQMTFKNYSTNKSVTLKANTVFKSLGITGNGSEKDYLTYFDATGTSYFAPGNFTVLPYWETPDGITVNGVSTRTITITEMKKSGISKTDSTPSN